MNLKGIAVNGIQTLVYCGLTLFGEYQQLSVKEGLIEHKLYMNYLSDFGFTAAITSVAYVLTPFSSRKSGIGYGTETLALAGTLAGMMTVNELASIWDAQLIGSGTFDIFDIPAYISGAAVAYGINWLLDRPKRTLDDKIAPQGVPIV